MKYIRFLSAVIACVMLLLAFSACGDAQSDSGTTATSAPDTGYTGKAIDYASEVKLDMSSDTAKQEVTVKIFVDGDTTHFNVPSSLMETRVLKARYLAVNTPESTGKIEEYGKAASTFTKDALSSAESIIVESDNSSWNLDSTGERHLVWVWYRKPGEDEYRNLNIEILQNGLAIASSSANNRYGTTCVSAINQAKAQKLNIYSGKKDPDFYYGDAKELTLRELRCNIESYNGIKVAFEGVVTLDNNNGVFVEEYDPETGLYFGIYVYYGFSLSGEGLDILSVGNRVRIVGTVSYYEAGGTYQVSGLTYRAMKKDDPSNLRLISKGNPAAFAPVSAKEFSDKVSVTSADDEVKTFDYANLVMNSSVSMDGLTVKSIYTTENAGSSSNGAMTLTCTSDDGTTIQVRTAKAFRDDDGKPITEDAYLGKTISVRGIVDYFDGSYQIKVFSEEDILIK